MLPSCAVRILTDDSPTGGGQHGRTSQQVLRHRAGAAAPAGGHPGLGLHGARAPHPVLQIDPLQTYQDHLLQGRRVGGAVQTGDPMTSHGITLGFELESNYVFLQIAEVWNVEMILL